MDGLFAFTVWQARFWDLICVSGLDLLFISGREVEAEGETRGGNGRNERYSRALAAFHCCHPRYDVMRLEVGSYELV